MAENDDVMNCSMSSVILDSMHQSADVLSNEDLAWVDSCLIKDHEVSDEGWNSLKDALLEILSSEHESVYSAAARNDSSIYETDIKILPSVEEAGSADYDLAQPNEVESTSDSEDPPINKAFQTQIFTDNVFQPNYNEGVEEKEITVSGHDSGISANELEQQASEDIFRVWDLDILTEEDYLVKPINKAMTGGSFESIQSIQGDSEVWKDLKLESIDDLIAGIDDLSLGPFSA